MKKSLALIAIAAALSLTACSAVESPAATVAPTTTATPSLVSSEPVEVVTPAASPAPSSGSAASGSESGSAYDQCVADARMGGGTDMEVDTNISFCDDMAEHVAKTPRWECWLELEETRPELFKSADPEQYSQDPEVIKACG